MVRRRAGQRTFVVDSSPDTQLKQSSMKSITTLSVLVPVYNEEHLVAASLERLKCLAESPVLERVQIIVLTCRKRLFTRLGAATLQIQEDRSA